jgi:multicomponent Na+:H+ antiporter subunit E
MLYVHVLDIDMARGLGAAREQVLETEARILRALASSEELAAAGLARNPRDPAPQPREAR